MDHRYLRYFIAVAEELSFTRAAERLHTVQPSLSQQIRRLEEIVGTPLFDREKHRLHLTEAGRVFLGEARNILQMTERAITYARSAARAEAGYMTIGFIPGIEWKIFPRILPILGAKYPGIELSLRSLTSPQQLEALQNRDINIGFMRPPIDDPDIAFEVLFNTKIVAVLPSGHPLAKLKLVPVHELAKLQFLGVSRSSAPAVHDIANEIAAKAGVTFKATLVAENVLMSLSEVSAGLGFCLLPEYVRQILPPGVVAKNLNCNPEPELPLLLAYRKDDRLPAVAFFRSLLKEQLGEQPALAALSARL